MTRRPGVFVPVLSLLLAACSSASVSGPSADGTDLRVQTIVTVPANSMSVAVDTVKEPLLPKGVDVVAIPRVRFMQMWEEPSRAEPDFLFDMQNPLGELAPVLVADARRADGVWYEIYLPLRPNGRTAWVRARDVKLRERDERIEVDLSTRVLRHFVDGELVDRIDVGIGTPATPTGIGTFYVWLKVPYDNPNQAYGIMALGLSGFSPVLKDWPGGGRMAVHGTPNPGDRGRAVSHGCVRVYNEDMEALLDVPLGTPVIISR